MGSASAPGCKIYDSDADHSGLPRNAGLHDAAPHARRRQPGRERARQEPVRALGHFVPGLGRSATPAATSSRGRSAACHIAPTAPCSQPCHNSARRPRGSGSRVPSSGHAGGWIRLPGGTRWARPAAASGSSEAAATRIARMRPRPAPGRKHCAGHDYRRPPSAGSGVLPGLAWLPGCPGG